MVIFFNFLNVLFNPKKFINYIQKPVSLKKEIYIPFAVIIFLYVINHIILSPTLLELISRDIFLSGDSVTEFTAKKIGGSFFMIIVTSITLLFTIAYYLFSMNILTNKTKIKFNQIMNLVAYSSLITWLGSFLAIIFISGKDILLFSSLAEYNADMKLYFTLTHIFGKTGNELIDVLFQTLSIFSIWQAIIIVWGLSVIYKTKIKIALIPELIITAVLYGMNFVR